MITVRLIVKVNYILDAQNNRKLFLLLLFIKLWKYNQKKPKKGENMWNQISYLSFNHEHKNLRNLTWFDKIILKFQPKHQGYGEISLMGIVGLYLIMLH